MPIHILPAQLANQIAAGEVVERPASVVKELVENCLDADATKVDIEIEKGGHKRILVRDDGKGINKDELSLALSRHATSKIHTLEDLEAISCLGFRGEALASISSVSRLTLTSKPADQEQAWQAYTEGRDMQVQLLPAAHPKGSSVEVLDLFFNTPARRKFLRAEKTEFAHLDEVVKRIALSRFDVAFSLKHNGKVVRHLPAIKAKGDPFQRIKKICGNEFAQHAIEINSDYQEISLTGWFAAPEYSRKQNDLQYFYLNGRMIRDKLVNHAIRQALEGLLPADTYPAYVLFLQVPAEQVDVNVHPSKHEVRFHQSRLVHDFILRALTDVFVADQGQTAFEAGSEQPGHSYIRPLEQNKQSQGFYAANATKVNESGGHYSTNSNIARAGYRPSIGAPKAGIDNYQHLMQVHASSEPENARAHWLPLPEQRLLLCCQQQYYALPLTRLWLAQLQQQWQQQAPVPQPLLMPVSLPVERNQMEAARLLYQPLLDWGIELGWNKQRILLRKVPAGCRALPWAEVLPKLLAIIPNDDHIGLETLMACFQHVEFGLDSHQQKVALIWLQTLDEKLMADFLASCNIAPVPLLDWLSANDY